MSRQKWFLKSPLASQPIFPQTMAYRIQEHVKTLSFPYFGRSYKGVINNVGNYKAILFSRRRTPAAFAGCIFDSIFISVCLN